MRKKSTPNVVDGKKIKKKRIEEGLSQLQLEAKSGVSQTTIWKTEEFNSDMYVSNLRDIAAALNASITEFVIPNVITVAG